MGRLALSQFAAEALDAGAGFFQLLRRCGVGNAEKRAKAEGRALADLAAEWGDVRRATIALFRNLPAAAWQRRGIASDQPISVRALAYIIAGHVGHHLEVLEARYSA